MRAKVRCGGERVPAVDELGGFTRRCRALRLPFKATAGLHHPVRGGSQHGFLNVAAAALFASIAGAAAQPTKVRFTLDWKLQGIHAWYHWAKDKGYFAAEKGSGRDCKA